MPIDYKKLYSGYKQQEEARSKTVQAVATRQAPPPPEPAPKKGGGIFASVVKGVADVALQPARFIERAGKAVGIAGTELMRGRKLTPSERQRLEDFYGPGLQERVSTAIEGEEEGKKYGTEAYKSGKEALGGGIQAVANLATPAVGGVGKLAIQGAALAGGKALEEDKSLEEAAMSTAIGGVGGAVLGKAGEVGGTLLSKGAAGVKQKLAQSLKPVAKKLAPYMTGISKQEVNTAFNKHPELTAKTLKILQEAADPTEAEGALRGALISKARSITTAAKDVEEKAFGDALDAVKAQFPDAKGDIPAVAKGLKEQLPRFGKPRTADETTALNGAIEIINEPREYTIDGMRALLSDLHQHAAGLEAGSPARKYAMEAWKGVRNELSKSTKGKIDPAMKAYSAFKDDMLEVSPVWSDAVKEDNARNFVKNLAGTERTAALEAMQRLGKRVNDDITPDIIVNRIAKKLAVDQKITGSRLGELMIGLSIAGGADLAGAVGGDKAKGAAQVAGGLLALKGLAPSTLSKVILSDLDTQGIKLATGARAQLAKALENPATWQAIMRAISGGPGGTPEEAPVE